MKKNIILFFILLFSSFNLLSQNYTQYFDGADTNYNHLLTTPSIKIEFNPGSNPNIWQIGKPQKNIFNSYSTVPNVIVTDTINLYAKNDTSSFQFLTICWSQCDIRTLRWKQKLDYVNNEDGGKVEFSVDGGLNWQNAFNNPNVYNFYGFNLANKDTLLNGDVVFSGTDTSWADIWLCFRNPFISGFDSLMFKFTSITGHSTLSKEGWMIDNLMSNCTVLHTLQDVNKDKYLYIYPNPSNNILHIDLKKNFKDIIIEEIELINSFGEIIDKWQKIKSKLDIYTNNYPNGNYFLKIKTNYITENIAIVINHD